MRHFTGTMFLVLATVSQVVLGQAWPDPVAHDVLPYETTGLTHGPCIAAPTDTSAALRGLCC